MNNSILITLSGIDKNDVQCKLIVRACNEGFKFNITGYANDIDLNLKEGCEKIRKYNNNYGSGSPYEQRPYYKVFSDVTDLDTTKSNLVRAFAVTSGFIQFWYTNEYEGHKSELSFYDEFYKYLTNQLLLDWTGDLDVQPQMYFLPIELTKEFTNENSRKPELDELYKLGLLQQFSSEGSVNFINYFVPLEIPDTDIILKKIKTLRTRKLWHQIVLGINNEIRSLVSNNKNWKD